jgi:hypothetical protein
MKNSINQSPSLALHSYDHAPVETVLERSKRWESARAQDNAIRKQKLVRRLGAGVALTIAATNPIVQEVAKDTAKTVVETVQSSADRLHDWEFGPDKTQPVQPNTAQTTGEQAEPLRQSNGE